MTLHPLQASPAAAEQAFGFLAALGFILDERWVSGGESYRDGWRLSYRGPRIGVAVEYLDQQLEVRFTRGDLSATYLEMDRDLFGRRSGFDGDMFPPEKLATAMATIAADIRENYGATLAGADPAWARIARLKAEPPTRKG